MSSQQVIWDYFQTAGAKSFAGADARLRYLAREAGTGKVLNIGVGDGSMERYALEHGADVYALDLSEQSIQQLRRTLALGDKARSGSCASLPFPDDFFDTIVISEVLEHLDDATLRSTLSETYRSLMPGGRLLGTVPARERLDEQTVICPGCGNHFHRWGHMQSFTERRLSEVLASYFRVECLVGRYFVTWHTLNWKGKVTAALKLVLSQLGIHGSGENLYFVARKP